MEFLDQAQTFVFYLLSFAVVISIIVFIHEYGHYWVAKKCGVKIEAFSIGFGKELKGWTDKDGTRWKIALFPLGGYVQMYGDAGESSSPDNKALKKMTKAQKEQAFHYKKLWQKAAIVAAGPAANFILSIVLLFGLFAFVGKPNFVVPAQVGEVMPGGAAEKIGMQAGDIITEIDGEKIEGFNDIVRSISMNPNENLKIIFLRNGKALEAIITPKYEVSEDAFGNKIRAGRIGIKSVESSALEIDKGYTSLGITESFTMAVKETYDTCLRTLTAVRQIFESKRSSEDIGGAPRIAKYVGQASEGFVTSLQCFLFGGEGCEQDSGAGFIMLVSLIALISANLGLINLFPIPMLDGGHLFFYAIEAIKGSPVNERVQDYAYRFGFFVLMGLMAFAMFNDGKFFGLY